MGKRLAAWAGCLLLLAAGAAAQTAATRGAGTIVAQNYAPAPSGLAVMVQPAQNSDQGERLKSAIEASLREFGARVADDSPLVLSFYATEINDAPPTGRPATGETHESLVPGSDQGFKMGMLSGLNQSLFGDQAKGAKPDQSNAATAAPRQVHLTMSLADQRGVARRLWQGRASGDVLQPDSFAVTLALVPFLVRRIGTTVADEHFELP